MGERDPGVAPPPAPRPWRQRALLAAALTALLVLVLVSDPVAGVAWNAGELPLVGRALLAPLAMVAGERAPAILGVLLLAVAAAFGSRALERRLGAASTAGPRPAAGAPQGPLLVGLLIFGSAAWAAVGTSGPAALSLCLGVTAFALAYGGGDADGAQLDVYQPPEATWRAVVRWLAVGLLLAELLPAGPLLAGLLIPAGLAIPRERRRSLLPVLLAGFAVGLGVELATRGPDLLARPLALATESFRASPTLAGWSLAHLLVGRNVGLLVGFAPLLLLLALGRNTDGRGRRAGRRWRLGDPGARPALAVACLALAALGALALPFDFAAGWLNLSFLPLYGALWHLPRRPPRRWEWLAAVLLCGLATWPLWAPPRAAVGDTGVELAAAWPRRYLPYERNLRSLPNRGESRLSGDLRVRAVAGCRFLGDPGRFVIDGGGPAEIWLAAPQELTMVALEFGPGVPSVLEVAGASVGRTVFRPDGRVGFEVLLAKPRERDRLRFEEGWLAAHLITIRLPGRQGEGPLRFRLLARPQPLATRGAKELKR